ncbi:hypothetical protein NUU61_005831 [Penicillium alfredii]|uniref:Uncharacterized protein n=1 Tax=Penicillium alfredii TaxID=1506179 RepID=A0A9W9FAF4_9EURO|nr:uncharacterized protein NUU61_005831 [Penicillium alfredii]KAJ5096475.1 hypothetical protein NUU61_005831 [Penicillium alfredii]
MDFLNKFQKLLLSFSFTSTSWLSSTTKEEPGFPSRWSLPPNQHDAFCRELVQLAAAIADFEPVRMHVRPEDMELAQSLIKANVKDASNITLIPSPVNHPWVRDTGPVYVRDPTLPSRRVAVNFRFNEWGNKAPENDGICWGQQWPLMDEKTLQENENWARWVIAHDREPEPVTRIDALIRAEGGGGVHDGDGTLIISESCIVDEARNPGMAKAEIEVELKRLLGIEKVLWFPGRKNIDITDSHMDAEARFVRPGVVVHSKPHDMGPTEWKELSAEIREILDRATDAKGRRLEIHILEEPDPAHMVNADDEKPAISYVNFYFVNGGLVIPQFGDEERDQKALRLLQQLLPERTVKQVRVNAIPLTGGVLHCVTQQVPAME